jgi:glycosyltransferase involved in cell wall biosynthesis
MLGCIGGRLRLGSAQWRENGSAPGTSDRRRSVVLFQWRQSAPYHVDRVDAVNEAGITDLDIVHVCDTPSSDEFPFRPSASRAVITHTLRKDGKFEETSTLGRLRRRLALLRRYDVRYAFLCHHELLDTFVAALVMRLLGTRVYLMLSSKFDDKPRWHWRELLKSFSLLPYHGALVGGRRQRDYAVFLGMRPEHVLEGYETISVARIRALAGAPPAPGGLPFADRHFTIVARHVAKKNLFMALDAYERYRQHAGAAARELHFCGSGPLEAALKAEVERRRIPGVLFTGFVSQRRVARALSGTLALLLPSTEEQWGLVINEALAMGVPVLCADNVGARDSLVRSAVNGQFFEPDNAEGLATLMAELGGDEAEWRRMSEAACQFAPAGDVVVFARAVAHLLSHDRPEAVQAPRFDVSPPRPLAEPGADH